MQITGQQVYDAWRKERATAFKDREISVDLFHPEWLIDQKEVIEKLPVILYEYQLRSVTASRILSARGKVYNYILSLGFDDVVMNLTHGIEDTDFAMSARTFARLAKVTFRHRLGQIHYLLEHHDDDLQNQAIVANLYPPLPAWTVEMIAEGSFHFRELLFHFPRWLVWEPLEDSMELMLP